MGPAAAGDRAGPWRTGYMVNPGVPLLHQHFFGINSINSYFLWTFIDVTKLIERGLRKSSSTTIRASCLLGKQIVIWRGWEIVVHPQNGLMTIQQQTNSPGLKFRYFMRMPVDRSAHLGCIPSCCHMKSWDPFISLKPLTSWSNWLVAQVLLECNLFGAHEESNTQCMFNSH